jgi:predicted lipid-binding transport protein (Tim44 family)
MSASLVELLILVAIAAFLLYRLRSVIGTKTGHQNPSDYFGNGTGDAVGGPDNVVRLPSARDEGPEALLEGLVEPDSPQAEALTAMIHAEPGFEPREFVDGAKQAYEMILMAFEGGDTDTLRQFLADDVYNGFAEVIQRRDEENLTVEARFIGVRDAKVVDAMFTESDQVGEITLRFVGEMVTVVRNAQHEVVEGDPTESQKSIDVWTFGRQMGASDPNWRLVATGG